ncbi:retroviral-like aspartic protease family protein [Candidatus Sumerlaeota bacterium]|nr:retroviral-like aspartic protease family protein [Candidatus Sumerlaeota bacterium]
MTETRPRLIQFTHPNAERPEEREPVGEVRVKVKVANAGDEYMFRRGLVPRAQIRSYEIEALVDTGAARTVIPPAVQEKLGLQTLDRQTAEYANGQKEIVGVSEPIVVEIFGRRTMEDALILGDEVLIGQTVLEKLDLWVDCASRRLVPNRAHPDDAVTKVKRTR